MMKSNSLYWLTGIYFIHCGVHLWSQSSVFISYCSPPWYLCCKDTGLLPIPQTWHICSYTYAPTSGPLYLLFLWLEQFSLDIPTTCSITCFKSLAKCQLLSEAFLSTLLRSQTLPYNLKPALSVPLTNLIFLHSTQHYLEYYIFYLLIRLNFPSNKNVSSIKAENLIFTAISPELRKVLGLQ